jgi:Pilus assembly protein, PilP
VLAIAAAAPEAAAQKRAAPLPLPFTYVGTLDQGAERYAVLAARDQSVLMVRAGDTIGNDYRVQSVTDERVLLVNLKSRVVEALARVAPAAPESGAAPVAPETVGAQAPPPEAPSEADSSARSSAPEADRARPGYGH